MRQNFTGREVSEGATNTAAVQELLRCQDVISALRLMLDIQSIRRREKKTAIIGRMASSRTWYAHMSREWPITPPLFNRYVASLAQSDQERTILGRLYAEYISKLGKYTEPQTPGGETEKFEQICSELGIAISSLSDMKNYKDFILRATDSRNVILSKDEIYSRIALIRSAVENHSIPSLNIYDKSIRLSLLAFMNHLSAYVRDDCTMQLQSIALIDSLTNLRGDPIYEYMKRAIRVYGLNTQDKTLQSSGASHPQVQKLILEEFIRMKEIVEYVETESPIGSLLFVDSAIDYNIASLLGEIDVERRNNHRERLLNIVTRDDSNGLPLISTIYNQISLIEIQVRNHDYDEAMERSQYCIDQLAVNGLQNLLVEAQIRLKRVKVLLSYMNEISQSEAHPIAAQIIDECTLAIPIAVANGNSRMELEFSSIKDLTEMKFGFR